MSAPARRRIWAARTAVVVLAGLGLLLLTMAVQTPAASAHPLGNFTVNTYSGLRVEPRAVNVTVVVDAAEIPTLQAFPSVNGGGVPRPAADAYRARECAALRDGTHLALDGDRTPLAVRSSSLAFPRGAAGLHTARLTCLLRTPSGVTTLGRHIDYTSRDDTGRVGWREITAVADGVRFTASTVPSDSLSGALTEYPDALLDSPLDRRTASLDVAAGGPAPGDGGAAGVGGAGVGSGGRVPAPASGSVDRLTSAYTELVAAHRLTFGFGVLAALIATALGGLHAFAPGHGKTLMAAYLASRAGTPGQAAAIGLTVTATHTIGVLALGLALWLAALATPERVYPWLALASGLLLVAIGANLLAGARRVGHSHRPGDHPQPHAPRARARGLLAVGFAGGMVPSPSALVVLLGGIAVGRAWFGVVLVVAYGLGMALALTGTGLALSHARTRLHLWAHRGPVTGRRLWALRLGQRLPLITAALVVLLGTGLALRAAAALFRTLALGGPRQRGAELAHRGRAGDAAVLIPVQAAGDARRLSRHGEGIDPVEQQGR
ncbi:MAG: nickel/cobalt transporter [Carbonactinosporaceae bacterium]